MVEGGLGVVEKTEGNPARQPLGIGAIRSFRLAMIASDLISLGHVAFRQGLARQDVPFGPPGRRSAQRAERRNE